MSSADTPKDGHVKATGHGIRGSQRFGHVTGHPPSAPSDRLDRYLVRDEETGLSYSFGYADIVTEGLRTIRTGERVRFLADHADPGHASYVIRLDMPDIGEYYK